eukprot:TRINITY_DN7510_c0_g4_i1.p2 TRINITY_DN7510_c0_g4~~TRINITY_DN7510_c0_g4_i1.p2  ORF type:complete len:133 (+),score=21.06 TRINITY_DN7510_c0_g4_i1:119-517(+)
MAVIVPRNFKLIDELEKAEKDPVPGVSLGLDSYDDTYLCKWNGSIVGPPGAFQGRLITLTLEATMEYPTVPPKVKFVQKVSMGCVDGAGNLKLSDILQWDTSKCMFDVLTAVRATMGGRERGTRQPPEDSCY